MGETVTVSCVETGGRQIHGSRPLRSWRAWRNSEMTSVTRQIETLFDGGSMIGLTDAQLLERFNFRRDARGEAAFAELVSRHGPMVLGVCHQLLDDRHHAEDAFQATFLVLARKARSISRSERLGNWLYGVALRTARCARRRLARRRKHEEVGMMVHSGSDIDAEPAVPPAEEAIMAHDQAKVLARRDRAAARRLSVAGRPLLPRGADRPRDGTAAPVAAWHGPQPNGPSARKASPRVGATRRCRARRRAGSRCSSPGPHRHRSHRLLLQPHDAGGASLRGRIDRG